MSRKTRVRFLDFVKVFDDVHTITRDELLEQVRYWRPGGSGGYPLKFICGLFAHIAELRGFHPFEYNEIYGSCNVCFVSSRMCEHGTKGCTVNHNDQKDTDVGGSENTVQTGPTQLE